MRKQLAIVAVLCVMPASGVWAQGTVGTYRVSAGAGSFAFAGGAPAQGGTTTIPTVLAPVNLVFEHRVSGGRGFVMDAARHAGAVAGTPIFEAYPFASGGRTQYADAMMRTALGVQGEWHTLLGKPEVRPVTVRVPVGYGYVLTSKASGRSIAVADAEFVQREFFKQVPRQEGKLILAFTLNTAFYALGDATVCCSWGVHGVDRATGSSFVMSTYLDGAPAVVEDQDVQPLTQQLAQFFKDPLNDPLVYVRNAQSPGNAFPAWVRPGFANSCGGPAAGSTYFQLEPTNRNPKNNFPASAAFPAQMSGRVYHLQNVALPAWYLGSAEGWGPQLSFPDGQALKEKAVPCPARGRRPGGGQTAAPKPSVEAAAQSGQENGHFLIGYWSGYGGPGSTFPLREVSPQWDVVLVAFSTPDKNAPEGTMQFRTPGGQDTAQFKADIAWLKSRGKKVLISLGGGGQHFTLADAKRVPNFVESVERIVREYGFDGIDIDFESPSLSIAPGDTDFRKPTTPSIVNLIAALKELRGRLGEKFLITLVPEGTQIPSGYPSYGGQFGSYLPILHALRDVVYFSDTQSYKTPPLAGLDGEIYQPGTVDYHVAMTELVLHGFAVGGDAKLMFPPMPENRVAVGFLNGDTNPEIVKQTMDYLITGKAPAGAKYRLRKKGGYPGMLGAMFWTIDADRRANYNYSNTVGPLLHGYPVSK
ncbi:MAG: glycoside hydrolase [Acidobacteria bacterium]|nr:glycoside hydrolase [Acidobacteriota bacterium]